MAVLVAVYLGVLSGLQALARTAESSGVVYPYRQEDWLRYLLPSLWPDTDVPTVLLAGPSTARENLLPAVLSEAFPGHRVMQGGISLGTMADVIAALDYVERVRGPGALPDVIVLGVSPRFLAEIPSERPFAIGLERYARWYRMPGAEHGDPRLEPKPALTGLLDAADFLVTKQGSRYRMAMVWLVWRTLDARTSERLWRMPVVRAIVRSGPVRGILWWRAVDEGPHVAATEWLSSIRHLEAYHLADSELVEWLDDPESFWAEVRAWDPAAATESVGARARDFLAMVERQGIALYVVSLPERSLGRSRAPAGFEAEFLELVSTTFAPTPVLDLRCFLADEEFFDLEHALPSGARRISRRVVAFIDSVSTRSVEVGTAPPPPSCIEVAP